MPRTGTRSAPPSDYAPDAKVILEFDDGIRCVPVLELLPEKYDGSKYPNRRKAQGD